MFNIIAIDEHFLLINITVLYKASDDSETISKIVNFEMTVPLQKNNAIIKYICISSAIIGPRKHPFERPEVIGMRHSS